MSPGPAAPSSPNDVAKARLEAVRRTGLGPAPDPAMDRCCRLVSRLLKVPVAVVVLRHQDEFVFPGAVGIGEPWASQRQAAAPPDPMAEMADAPVLVPDRRPGPSGGSLRAPLTDEHGWVLGRLCAVDALPRSWDDDEVTLLTELAEGVSAELRARIAATAANEARAQAERAVGRLRRASEASSRLSAALRPEDTMARLLSIVVPDLAVWAAVFLAPTETEPMATTVRHRDTRRDLALVETLEPDHRPLPADHPASTIWRGTAGAAVVTSTEASGSGPSSVARGLADFGGSVAVCTPIAARGQVLGALLLAMDAEGALDDDDVAAAADLGLRAGLALDNARRFAIDHDIASTLQRSLLPRLPEIDGLELCAEYWPAANGVQVGGDWYDAMVLPDGSIGLVVGDVSGHDIAAAGVMGRLRGALRSYAWEGHSPATVLDRLDRTADGLLDGHFASCLYLRATVPASRSDLLRIQWSSAGHLPPAELRPDGEVVLWTEHMGPVIGIGEHRQGRREGSRLLEPGSLLALYTDGLIERRFETLDESLVRLSAALRLFTATDSVGQLAKQLITNLEPDGDDDVALLMMRWPAAVPPGADDAGLPGPADEPGRP